MRYRISLLTVLTLFIVSGCQKDNIVDPEMNNCSSANSINKITLRNFEMGFSTWSFGPDLTNKDETYEFIAENADIYSEQIDNKIPWSAWINDTELPSEFINDIQHRVSNKIINHKLLLSVSLLDTDRSNLLEDYDGTIPAHSALNDQIIEDAYFKHLEYLIAQFHPEYLIMAMEVNELRLKSPQKWSEYKTLMANLRIRLKDSYPNLMLAESITLHNWYDPEVDNPGSYIEEISEYTNQNMDFAAISFYPFFKGFHSKSDFQIAFDFLHSKTTIPVAFVETNHLAEDLIVESFNTNIDGSICEQKDYLDVLLNNAYEYDYEFLIWWAYRDYDELWETFPDDVKDIGKLWRDTGLLDEDGNERPAFTLWKRVYSK